MSGTDGSVAQRAGNAVKGMAGDAKNMAGQAVGNEGMKADGEKMRKEADAQCAALDAAATFAPDRALALHFPRRHRHTPHRSLYFRCL